MTRRLAPCVNEIQAVDFAEHLIANARKFAPAPNVQYFCADAVNYLAELVLSKAYIPSKVLLGDALCYFDPRALTEIRLPSTYCNKSFQTTGIPCD